MKTTYIFSAVLFLVALQTNAQYRIAIVGGPNSSSIVEKNKLPGWDTAINPNYSHRGGANLGIILEVPISDAGKWYFQPGLLYQGKGRKFFNSNDSETAILTDTLSLKTNFFINYIEVPLNITHRFPIGKKSNILVSAGPYVGFFYSGKQTSETRFFSSNEFKKEEVKMQVGKANNKVSTVDFGVNARAGLEVGNLLVTGFFSKGLTNFYTADYNGSFKNQVIGFSLGFWLRPGKMVIKDSDKDGVADPDDICPNLPGSLLTKGCPDLDGDGIADASDKCPELAGNIKYNGCPVPDFDKDGIKDDVDLCPEMPGVAKYSGCPVPDRDGDGVTDELDQCPDSIGMVEFHGCPVIDTDGDGLNDKEDNCPMDSGSRENKGCPVIEKAIAEKVTVAARSIFFNLGSGKLSKKSFASLDEVVELLEKNPAFKLEIEGHTDNIGVPLANLSLSLERANAVKIYFVKKGIDQSRLIARGFGQEKPIADNTTPEGKLQNRRVELKLVSN